MEHKNVDLKLHMTKYAYQSFDHTLSSIKSVLRSGEYNKEELLEKNQTTG